MSCAGRDLDAIPTLAEPHGAVGTVETLTQSGGPTTVEEAKNTVLVVDEQRSRRGAVVPGDVLAPLVRLRMSGLEWRVVITVMLSPELVSARTIASRLRRDYGLVKRVVRGLVAWRILERAPAGLRFDPDSTRWGPPEDARPT
ncbi:MAG: hypothetical protein HYU88_13435 [Chloroflexi bacterium]|nr:hypothetical protein [Chloroflexota bacterium]